MFQEQHKKLNITIAVLSILLALSLTALVSLLFYNHSLQTALSAHNIAPDNIISATHASSQTSTSQTHFYASPMKATRMVRSSAPASAKPLTETSITPNFRFSKIANTDKEEILSLYNKNPQANKPFSVNNMFPGDHVVQDYCVRVYHKGSLDIFFRANIRDEAAYEKLAEVLKVKVFVEGEERYDGLMRDMPASIAVATPDSRKAVATELDYQIDVYLDTSVGNDYKNKELVADFIWWANVEEPDDDDDKPVPPDIPDTPDQPDQPIEPDEPTPVGPPVDPEDPDDGGGTLVDPPQTGYDLEDRSLMKIALGVSCGVLFISSALLFFLIQTKEKEEEDKHVR